LNEVEKVQVLVKNFTLFVNWSHPFTLARDELTTYNIEITNHTSNDSVNFSTDKTEISMHSERSRRVACDSFTITVTPYNEVGEGRKRKIPVNYAGKI